MVSIASISGTALNIGVIILTILIVVGIVGFATYMYGRWKKYREFDCIIFEKDGFGQITEKTDKAGVFVDNKTKNKRFFMKSANVGLDPDNIPYVRTANNKKVVYLLQHGLKNFRYLKFGFQTERFRIKVGEEDVNWAINEIERQKKVFSQSMWMQLMPYIAIAFVTIAILVIFIYFFKGFGDLKLMAEALRDMSANVAQAKTGTTVITGGG